jgi:hypothetical protein
MDDALQRKIERPQSFLEQQFEVARLGRVERASSCFFSLIYLPGKNKTTSVTEFF